MRGTYIIVSKGTLHFKYVFKEQTKQLQKDEIKEESQLNCTNVFFLFSSSSLLLVTVITQ